MNRKDFVKTTALGTLGSAFLPGILGANPSGVRAFEMLDTIGIQLFSLPKMLEADLRGTLAMLAELGYGELELFGPYPFSAASTKASWQQLIPLLGFSGSGCFGVSTGEFKAMAGDLGLKIPSLHTDLDTLDQHMPILAAEARALGATYVTLPLIPAERRQSLDDYQKMADTFNRIGKSALDEGVRFAYHNHGYGLQEQDGKVPFRLLVEATDPQSVFLQMDVFWTVAGKADPTTYLNDYAGRYKLMHLKDMKERKYFSGDGGDPGQWMELFPLMASAGKGVLDLQAIVKTALETGVDHFFVEQDLVANPREALGESQRYLGSL
ncbi:sugar phosphate isomerase/epimerase family protein [Robiginitalea marina]|uniref:Sugar phosphate isomerase/epimerase n=1 Tax=Robiginitalea marina TaxID=2954105 RepID=A0ABT1AZ71_9FLAO|nr:sugar phosphate isomerase/epimerase [Robiginitalea marina]MCO5725344.1 sugar phosphate isomerase/epimerase [Robiginitalea marina]